MREGYIRRAYQGADATLALVRSHLEDNVTTFVASDHGFAPQFLAIDASKVLVDLGLLSLPQVSNCRTATGETIGLAKACWAGGTVQVYLNLAGRDPVVTGMPQVAATDAPAVIESIVTAFENLDDPNDWNHDGQPENWTVIDRVFTKPETRYIPNNTTGGTADMAHPTRTGDVVAFSYPPYQFDAATPGTLVSLSHFFGQHGYVPDVQDTADNVNMRATFIAGGEGIVRGTPQVRSIDIAPTLAFLLRHPVPQHSQGRVLLPIIANNTVGQVAGGHRAQRLPRPARPDDPECSTTPSTPPSAAPGYLGDACSTRRRPPCLTETRILAGGDNVGASPPNSGLLQDVPAIDVENAWPLDATDLWQPRVRLRARTAA